MKKILLLTTFFSVVFSRLLLAQSSGPGETTAVEADKETLSISLEFRPRAELRHGYQQLPNDTTQAAFFISHRGRLNLDYRRKRFLFHTTIQDIRVWGEEDPRSERGWLQTYEFYVQPSLTDHLSVRIGRQRVQFDDERLFSENDWRQTGNKHDGVRFIFERPKFETHLLGAFDQTEERIFGTTYYPGFDNYKVLVVDYLKYKLSEKVTLSSINYTDGYQSLTNPHETDFKVTNGGRVAYSGPVVYLTFAGYYQWGRIPTGESISAFYLEPEASLTVSKAYTARLGAQVFSGDNNPTDAVSHAFVAQHGSIHRFNGRMDYTNRTVRTYNHEGIVNPYLIQDYKFSKKYTLSWESHLLATQKDLRETEVGTGKALSHVWGFENDFRLRYRPNSFTDVELAYMFMLPGKTLEYLRQGRGGNSQLVPQFTYLQLTFTPELFSWSRSN